MTFQKPMSIRFIRAVLGGLIPSRLRPASCITRAVASKTHSTVQAGPFRNMRYVGQSYWSPYIPKLLGIYERELSGCIEEATCFPLQSVVDIGAAEGYYAVGLALRMPQVRVIAFEMEPSAQLLIRELARLNGVESRVAIEGVCTSRSLSASLDEGGKTLVICDAEGAEAVLLDPIRIPALMACPILVELHDHVISGLSQEIRDRFTETHDITHIVESRRDRSEFPYRTLYTTVFPSYADWAVSEIRRHGAAWYWMCPRTTNKAA